VASHCYGVALLSLLGPFDNDIQIYLSYLYLTYSQKGHFVMDY
jgi:hypothetical protein